MPRPVQQLTVFVASPGDVEPERARVENAVREVNLNLLSSSQDSIIQLALVRWETHAYPSFGQDPQAVINAQIGTEYDIFIGILWSRVGTPTPRFPSGTLEEFWAAYKKWQSDRTSVTLMIYFKDEPLSPSQLDTSQLAQVQSFKKELSSAGGLHWTFKTVDDFETIVRLHLTRAVQDWRGRLTVAPVQTVHPVSSRAEESDEVELGFIDYMELSAEAGARHEAVLARMTSALQQFQEQMELRTTEAQTVVLQPTIPTARLLVEQSARDLNDLTASLLAELSQLSQAHTDLLKYQVGGAASSLEFGQSGKGQVRQVLSQLDTYTGVMRTARLGVRQFHDILAQMPRMAVVFNKAKRRALEAVEAVEAVFAEMVKKNNEVGAEISELLDRAEADN
jgi:CRISPR/Cas system CSM-associated protein Csm2 small subunit